MLLSLEDQRGLDAVINYANTACISFDLDQVHMPSHSVELRLDKDGTPYVHAASVLLAVNRALTRPGVKVSSVDKFQINKPITRDLYLSVGNTPHKSSFPDAKPAVEITITFADGLQRTILGYDFGTKVTRKDDPSILAFAGHDYDFIDSDIKEIENEMNFVNRPGIFIANWLACGFKHASERPHMAFSNTDPFYRGFRTLIHSVADFKLPEPSDAFSRGRFNFPSRIENVRPLKKFPNGNLVSTHVDLMQCGKIKGGGKVNFALLPS